MKYSIVIPTYNNCDKYLKPCVESILQHTNMDDVELVISANGCTDNTYDYIQELHTRIPNMVSVWDDDAIGFSKATNAGIKEARADKIVLLNNDTVILGSGWLERLDVGDIGAVLTQYSPILRSHFAVFFCVMVQKHVFDKIGLLDEQYGVGGCEDIDFCYLAETNGFKIVDVGFRGDFPIYHVAEGTVHDETLVQNWKDTFYRNELKLAKKYSMDMYKFLLSNNYERAVFLKGDMVFPRETQRYEWAARNLLPGSVLEIGCSTGYGYQFLPTSTTYLGLDYDPIIIDVAKEQEWSDNATFYQADINTFYFGRYGNIIAFEVIEHLDNGLEVVEKLKQYCKRLLITVPHNEPKGFWGEHHKLHGLTEKDFPGFKFAYINYHGGISSTMVPVDNHNPSNLMICEWTNA